MKCKLSVHIESWPIQAPFRINGTTWEKSELVVCEIERDGVVGRGEGVGMCGGLTAALELAAAARLRGMRVMVGNMLGTSLSMAPAHIIGRLADFADLDGPLLLSYDRPHGMRYEAGQVYPPPNGFWGRSCVS